MPVSAAYYEAKQQKFVVVSYLWFIKLTFMVVSHGIFLVELFLRPPWHAAPGDDCPLC